MGHHEPMVVATDKGSPPLWHIPKQRRVFTPVVKIIISYYSPAMQMTTNLSSTIHRPTVPHPLGRNARVLLTSVYGPYAVDDEDGSRIANPMELYHNQVTREQGPFSLRMFHRSWGIMMIAINIDAPCRMLDFPTKDRLISELQNEQYDVIGITAIMPNTEKVRLMCQMIREYQPQAQIVVGGHIASALDLGERIDADHIVRGEGVRWMRTYLGDDTNKPLRHPLTLSGYQGQTMGVRLSNTPRDTAATLIPSVGCPLGCNFCATSALFGGKGKSVAFYEDGDELFEIMAQTSDALGTRSFFIMDENFLINRPRAMRLLERMQNDNRGWSLYVFSSANVLSKYTLDELVALGISWVWMGLEGKESQYTKTRGIDTRQLVAELQSHGICVLGSSIIGMENHTPENIAEHIEYAAEHDTDFHQFMLYTPLPGTALHAEHKASGTLLSRDVISEADSHGQCRFNFIHPHIRNGEETEMLRGAFIRDFERNGPSVLRIARTVLQGWQRHKNHPEQRVRERYQWWARDLAVNHAAALSAAKRWLSSNNALSEKLGRVLDEVKQEFGLKARIAASLGGRFVYSKIRREHEALKAGRTYEPPTYYEHNDRATEQMSAGTIVSELCRWVEPTPSKVVI